jgi:hypothetical protein
MSRSDSADTAPRRIPNWLRVRAPYVALTIGTIALGLAIHLRGDILSPAVRDVLGDALWAAMVAWGGAVVAPALRPPMRGLTAVAICVAVEFSQLYHAPALDAIRRTTAGHLLLGSGFDQRDLGAYAAGVLAAMIVELVVRRAADRPRR